jgi:peptidoglycan/LPS O-acetylase OafA/YrhL
VSIRYNPALDGLRAIAVLAVIAYHSSVPYFGWGPRGVDVFFVLSGYLITSILRSEIDAGGIRLGAFYLRRIRRLYPALIALVATLFLIGWCSWKPALHALLYLTDYVQPIDMLGHTWSLSVEEHYYLLWPLLLPFVVKLKRPVWVLLAIWVAATLWSQLQPFPYREAFRFDTRLTGLVFGSMLAFLPVRSKLPMAMLVLSVAAYAFGLPADRAVAESATAAVILLSQMMTLPFLARPTFVFVGRISYGMYLYHWPVEWVARGWFDMETAARFGTTMVGTVGLATISYFTVEAWFRKPRKEAVVVVEPVAS